MPWLSLTLLWVAYALVGWNLAARHVIWFGGLLIVLFVMAGSWASIRWVERGLGFIPQILLVVLAGSILTTLTLTSALFLKLGLIPFLTTFFAWNEMQFLNFSSQRTGWTLVAIAVLGLSIGEFLDIWVLPSDRY